MNRQWMYSDRRLHEFTAGLNFFIGVAEENKWDGFIYCPCVKCQNNINYSSSKTLHTHLMRSVFMLNYNYWTKHGEIGVMMEDNEEEDDDDNYPMFPEDQEASDEPADDLGWAIADAKRDCETEKERLKFDQMLEDHNKLLYRTCEDGQKKLGSLKQSYRVKSQGVGS